MSHPVKVGRKRGRGWMASAMALSALGLSIPSLAAGDAGAQTAHAKNKVRTVNVDIVDGSTAASSILPYFAERTGIFRRYHINATIDFVGSAIALADLASGKAQFGDLGAPEPEEVAQSGAPVKWVGIWDERSNLQLVAGPGIHSVSQLQGKSIGISTTGSVTNTFAAWIMQQNHVPVGSVHYVPLQSSSGILAGFIGGTVDALLLSPPNSTNGVKGRPGSSILMNTNSKSYAWPFNGLAGYMPWVTKHKAATVRVLEAMTVALREFAANPKAAEAAIVAEQPGTDQATAVLSYKSAASVFNKTELVPSESLEKQVLKLITRFYPGQYPNAVARNSARFIDASYAQQAEATLGPTKK